MDVLSSTNPITLLSRFTSFAPFCLRQPITRIWWRKPSKVTRSLFWGQESGTLWEWTSPLTHSSVTRTCRPRPGATWTTVKSWKATIPRLPLLWNLCSSLILTLIASNHPSLDDMPDLQEVEEDQRSPGVFQVTAGVSHEEFSCSPNTNWLAELADIATSPESPLLKNAPHKRFIIPMTFDMCRRT